MLKKLIYFLFVTIFLSCGNSSSKNNEKKIVLKEYQIPKTEIRAISAIDSTTVWYGGSNEHFGFIRNSVNIELELDSFPRNEKKMNFRGIVKNGENLFLLSIEKPAGIIKFNQGTSFVYKDTLENAFFDAINFWNDKEGLVMGDPTNGCLTILKTTDGGNSWNRISCDKIPTLEEGEAAFAASNTNIALYENNAWIVTGGKKARILHSKDKGETWEIFNTPVIQGLTMTGIYSVDFLDANTGIIMGGNWDKKQDTKATKAMTIDGGKTWTLIANEQIPGYISCVKFVPETNGKEIVAVSSEGIYFSGDKGDNWSKLSEKGFYTISFVSPTVAWLGGSNKLARLTLK
ncbi:WD40/YVTN/BNR-like repeat-containing protein [Aureivirga marina]|uniref:WD40/YVTN/BNR-like repeat-containing protein n=1 Tax=Aureivirga marina TaxID=1182451 RepID=UPI0018CA6556|nr:oxidoreductase [Aureivirga marina]